MLLICTVLYLIPRTVVLGAILLTGYLGGAVATQVRIGSGAFPLVSPVILGTLLWGGLYLRDARLRSLVGVARRNTKPPKPTRAALPCAPNVN